LSIDQRQQSLTFRTRPTGKTVSAEPSESAIVNPFARGSSPAHFNRLSGASMRLIASLILLSSMTTLAAQQATPPENPPVTPIAPTQPTTAADAAQRDSSFIDADGRAHITRIVPVPADLSRQSRYWLGTVVPDAGPPESLAQRRASTDKWAAGASLEWQALYPAKLTEEKIADVPVRVVVPADMPEANKDKVLLNLHGGNFLVFDQAARSS
jgi:epsilon-lactone hydrolase